MRKKLVWGEVGGTGRGWTTQTPKAFDSSGETEARSGPVIWAASKGLSSCLAKLTKMVACIHCPLLSLHPCSRGERLPGQGIFLKTEATETSTSSCLQAASSPQTFRPLEWGQASDSQEEAAQRCWPFSSHTPPSQLPRPAALPSTSCPPRPTFSKRLFFQKHELSKTVFLPELESEIITPRNTHFLGKPFRASRCLWTRQSWVC